jgi:peptidoglycan/xylan/chitin deacetylase (PgdA/CDA1 family)/GT2 family glycosyltransferase
VLEVGAGGVRSVAPALRHVALTFDDGPDPRWTPAILRVLAREHVVGTFFVIGEQVSAHPDLVRRAVEGGNEVGVHTYRHLEVTHQDAEAFRRDVRLTQLAVVGATGHETVLFRPPFIVNPRSVDFGQYVALWRAGTMGYLTALADRDPADWARPGVRAIVDRAMPRHGAGAIVELHDGGGDRSQTVAALGPLIRRLKRAGYAFDTVGAVARLPMARTMPRAPLMERLWGRAFLTSVGAAGALSTAFFVAVAIAAILSLLRIAVVVALATRARRRRAGAPIAVAAMPSVTVLVAARDEERSLPATLRALCELRAGAFEIVVIDDGSRDGTARVVEEWPDDRVRLVRRAHAGKAAALDAGLAASVGDIVVTVDADTRLERDALRWIVEPFGDPAVGAVSGNLRVRSASGWLGRAQQLEYVVANAFDRRALDALGTQVTVPGAIGAYRRSALVAVGGFDAATMAEDTDLTLALVAAGSTIRFAPEALAYTETPTSVRSLWRQRSRWSFGILQSVWRRRSTCARWATNRRAGATWTFALASQVLLPLTSPLLDVAAAWALLTGTGWLLLVWGALTVLQLAAAAYALRCEGESWRALWAFPLHVLGYRQLTALVVPQSLAWAASGRRPSWGRRRRPVRATTVGRRPVPARTPAAGRAPRRRREDVAPAPV